MPPPEVGIVTVTPASISEVFEVEGQVEPFRRVEVRSRVDGIVEERPFVEGSTVNKGQLLYTLDRIRYEAAHRSAQVRYDNAKRTLDRLEPLLARNAVAQQEVDNARTEVETAKAQLDQTKKDLDDTYIKAEISGQIGKTRIDVGGRVTGSGDLLTTIDQLDPAYVTFRPSTQQLLSWKADPKSRGLIQPGSRMAVRVVFSNGMQLPRVGHLAYVAPSVDPSTGTQEFRAQFENGDHMLVPGQFVRVRLEGFSRPAALAVPQRAVQQAHGRQFVYLVGPGDTVITRDVQTGPWSGDRWIIESGLAANDRVIVDGIQKIAPGRKVKPVVVTDTAKMPASTAVKK
jgi:membrane fusion protein (multidrug efflux system)